MKSMMTGVEASTWSTKAADAPVPGNQGSGAPGMGGLPGPVRSALPQGAGCRVCSVCGKTTELYFDDRCTFLHGYYILINGLKSSSSKRLQLSWKER